MRLHLTDYHLASARLALKDGNRDKACEHFEKAEPWFRKPATTAATRSWQRFARNWSVDTGATPVR